MGGCFFFWDGNHGREIYEVGLLVANIQGPHQKMMNSAAGFCELSGILRWGQNILKYYVNK